MELWTDKYDMFWGNYENSRPNTVCRVQNYNTSDTAVRIIPIILDNILMSDMNMRMCMAGWNDSGPHIVVSSLFLELPKSISEVLLWHEVGHVHYEHHHNSDHNEMKERRLQAILNGEVVSEELEADKFSLRYCSISKFKKALKFILKTRPKGKGKNDLGRLELKLRIKKISKKD